MYDQLYCQWGYSAWRFNLPIRLNCGMALKTSLHESRATATTLCTLAPNVSESWVWNLHNVTLLAPRIFELFLDFSKISASLVYAQKQMALFYVAVFFSMIKCNLVEACHVLRGHCSPCNQEGSTILLKTDTLLPNYTASRYKTEAFLVITIRT
jgi:hypothetical protein